MRLADALARDVGLRWIGRIARLTAGSGAACSAIVGVALAQHTGAAAGTSMGGTGTLAPVPPPGCVVSGGA